MATFNRVILLGNLTRDVELKHIPSGTAVAEFGMAINHRRKDQGGEWVSDPVYVDVTAWGRTAEVASEYLSKGSPVHVEGRLRFESWESRDGKRSKVSVVCERLQLIGGNRNGKPQEEPETELSLAATENDENVPF